MLPLACLLIAQDNEGMTIPGRIQNGVVVLEGGVRLPEGTLVSVSLFESEHEPPRQKKRLVLPLVASRAPGSLELTGERVAEILDEGDVPS